MSCKEHQTHNHKHDAGCGHKTVTHSGHTDYLHDGHLHHSHEGHYDEHALEVSATNPRDCTSGHKCITHDSSHKHGPNCGHEVIPHGDHQDYLVGDHLHHFHSGHCDHHGHVEVHK